MELRLSARSLELVRSAVGSAPPDDAPAAVRRCLCADSSDVTADVRLSVEDVRWLRPRLLESGASVAELVRAGEMELPSVKSPPRDPELEARCQRLRNQQANDSYSKMVRNVDSRRLQEPALNIGKQLREVNAQLVEVGQVLFSVFAAFLFGYMAGAVFGGGRADTGTRILCGLAVALVVLIAEGYFLVRYLSTTEHPPAASLHQLTLADRQRRLTEQREAMVRRAKAKETAALLAPAPSDECKKRQ